LHRAGRIQFGEKKLRGLRIPWFTFHEELITTLGNDAYHLSQIKTWLQRFNNGDLSCKDYSRLSGQS
jgi:hypothetical protein